MHTGRTAGTYRQALNIHLTTGEYSRYLIQDTGKVLAIYNNCIERKSFWTFRRSTAFAYTAIATL